MKSIDREHLLEFVIFAGKRALWTFAEVALSMIVIGMPFSQIEWGSIIDVAVGASIVSILKSIIAGMPEFSHDGEVMISDETCRVNLGLDENQIKSKKSIRLKVIPNDKK